MLSGPMADARTTLNVAPRTEFGSRTARRMRREGLVPGVVYSGGVGGDRLPGLRTRCPRRDRRGRGPLRPLGRRRQSAPRRGQGAAAPPGQRHPPPHRSARGQPQRGDPGGGPDRARGRRGRARRESERRARARHPRNPRRSAADRYPGQNRRRRLRDGDQRHPAALLDRGSERRHLHRRRGRRGHDRHPGPAARRRGRAGDRGRDRAGRRVRGGDSGDGDSGDSEGE